MSRRDGYQPGVPFWIAGAHPDPQQAVAFYGELLGWQATETGAPDPYFVCSLHGRDVAGIGAPLGADAGAAWRTNIWVESADETAARAAAEGGSVVTEPFDLPGIGRAAVLADPAGAVFGGAVLDGPLDLPIGRQATLADPQGATFSVTRIATA